MRPLFEPSLLNDAFGDPGLYVDIRWNDHHGRHGEVRRCRYFTCSVLKYSSTAAMRART
jgi:hypothetical protein